MERTLDQIQSLTEITKDLRKMISDLEVKHSIAIANRIEDAEISLTIAIGALRHKLNVDRVVL